MRGQAQAHSTLARALNDIRVRGGAGTTAELDQFATQFSDAGEFLNVLVSDAGDQALALREAIATREGHGADINRGENDEAAPAAASPLNEEQTLAALRANTAKFDQITSSMAQRIRVLLNGAPQLSDAKAQRMFDRWKKRVRDYLAGLPDAAQRLHEWNPYVPVPWYRSIASFLFGKDWTTASFWQDWYGIIPLLVGSIMVSSVALLIAVPFGVFSAIYVSEIAQRGEKSLIKPYIE